MNYAMSQGCTWNTLQKKKKSFKPAGKGHTSPGKNVAGKVFPLEYEMPMNFQVSVANSQDNFFKIP